MDDCGNSLVNFSEISSDLILDNTTFSIWAIYKGVTVKVPNIDRHKRPALKFKQMESILEREYKHKICELPCLLQQGHQLRSSKIISSQLLHTSPSKAGGIHPSETFNVLRDVTNDHSDNENSVDNGDLILSGLTLKQIRNISKARRVTGTSFPNYSLESSGSNDNIIRCGRGIKRSCVQKFEDDSDFHETLGSWREKVSSRMAKARQRLFPPKEISFSMHGIPPNGESPNILKSDGHTGGATVEPQQDVAASSVSVCDSAASVGPEHSSSVEIKTEAAEVYPSTRVNVIVDSHNQNYLCCQPFKFIDVATEGDTQNRGSHISSGKPSNADVTVFYEECLSHQKPGNQIENSTDASNETCTEASDRASSTVPDMIFQEEEMLSPLTTKNGRTEMYDAPVNPGGMVSANYEIVKAVYFNPVKFPEDLPADHVCSELRAVPLGEKATPGLDTICTEQYCNIDVPETGDFPARLPAIEGFLECTSGGGLASESLAVQSSADIDNKKTPHHLIPNCRFDCDDLQQSALAACESASKSPEDLVMVENDNCGYLLVNVAKSEATGDTPEPFSDRKTNSSPKKLFVKRKSISPTSQEKLCQAMDVWELYDGLRAENRKQRMLFEKTKIASSVECPEDTETLPKTSFAGDCHLPSMQKSLSRKGILKSSCGPCIESCTCRECASIRAYAQKTIDFSQRQMHDIECLASKLLRELKSMKTIVKDNLLVETSLLLPNERVDELRNAANTANEVEETTRKWLNMMSRDCNRFCKIMKIKEKKHSKGGSAWREQRRITFADEAGGSLCHVKFFQDDSASLLENTDAKVAVAAHADQCE